VNGVSERVFRTAQELASDGRMVIPIQADLSRRQEVRRLFDETLEKLGG
jgi:hypothetical protein